MSTSQSASFGFGIPLHSAFIDSLVDAWLKTALDTKVITHVATPASYRTEPRFDQKTGAKKPDARIKVSEAESYYTFKGFKSECKRELILKVLRPTAAIPAAEDMFHADFVGHLFPSAQIVIVDFEKQDYVLTLPKQFQTDLSNGSIYSSWNVSLPLPTEADLAQFELIRTQLREIFTAANVPESKYYPKTFAPVVAWSAVTLS